MRAKGASLTAYVVLKCAQRLADEVAGRAAASSASRKIRGIVEKHGGVVLPSTTPAGEERGDSVFTTVQVADMDRANKLARALRNMPGIEAAYAKPGEELP
jgi:hypothetical protein